MSSDQRVTKIRQEDAELLALLARDQGRDRTEILHRALVLYHDAQPAQTPAAAADNQVPGVQGSATHTDAHEHKGSTASTISKRRRRK